MKEINSKEFGSIRTTLGFTGEALFNLNDVCKALELDARHVRARLCDDVVSTDIVLDTKGRRQKMLFVNEDGLYDIILDSRKPEAKRFRKWITSEVLPNIRKHGGYMMLRANESNEELMARALQMANDALQKKDKLIDFLQPKADYTDEVLLSKDCLTITQIAKELGMTAQTLNKLLSDQGIQYRQSNQWMLYSKYAGMGLAQNRTHPYSGSKGSVRTQTQMVWTEKGRLFIHNLIKRLRQQATYDLFSMNNDLQTFDFNTHTNYEEII
ncbi:MAG: phage antirepressor KilAC domain-containing protein [Bacteroidaceae bacterium]|nr:phage antirepressor KilAC domain-containing protein [Bacteroidaceae bacterium]